MNENMPRAAIKFTTSERAKQYIQSALALCSEEMSARGLAVCLSYSGGFAPEKDGKILWNYRGPNFLLGAQKPGHLPAGGFFDLFGFRVWIGEIEQSLLQGRTLTTIQYGNPEPAELLVIENAPEDYFEAMMRGGKL